MKIMTLLNGSAIQTGHNDMDCSVTRNEARKRVETTVFAGRALVPEAKNLPPWPSDSYTADILTHVRSAAVCSGTPEFFSHPGPCR
jgi:hypothetical protein